MTTLKRQVRAEVDRRLTAAGWRVCDFNAANLRASRGVAIEKSARRPGPAAAEYRVCTNRNAGAARD